MEVKSAAPANEKSGDTTKRKTTVTKIFRIIVFLKFS
jgi:hypothetical protein